MGVGLRRRFFLEEELDFLEDDMSNRAVQLRQHINNMYIYVDVNKCLRLANLKGFSGK